MYMGLFLLYTLTESRVQQLDKNSCFYKSAIYNNEE